MSSPYPSPETPTTPQAPYPPTQCRLAADKVISRVLFSPSSSPALSPYAQPYSPTLSPSGTKLSPPLLSPSGMPESSSSSFWLGIVTVLLFRIAVVGVIVTAVLIRYKKKRSREQQLLFAASASPSAAVTSGYSAVNSSSPLPPKGFSQITFTYKELATATNGFSDANLLGQGGFGYVHRGVLPNGQEVAVKQLKVGSRQGEREFQAEVEIISHVHHKHLVCLIGYCMTGSDRLLVYEFVPNNTMEFHLHGKGRPVMDWPTRKRIALGSAKGLAYLHEYCHVKVIHRDIKAANILIDFEFDAKVADFGLAKLSSDANTHVSTRVMGTFGYLAPEYAASGKLTEKSDVFSFGVMLLELITGRRPVEDRNSTYMNDSLVDWARPLLTQALEEGNFSTLVDERLEKNYNHDEMLSMVSCAAASVRYSAQLRPRMSQIVRALEGNLSLSEFNEEIKPGHSKEFIKDMEIFGPQEMGSSGNPTSEHGLNTSGS